MIAPAYVDLGEYDMALDGSYPQARWRLADVLSAVGRRARTPRRDSQDSTGLERITNVKGSAAGYGNFQQWIANTKRDQRLLLEDYSVSNRGLRSGLVGTPDHVLQQVLAVEDAGVDLLLLQCSPQLEEMERFAKQVIAPYRAGRRGSRPRPARPGIHDSTGRSHPVVRAASCVDRQTG